MNADVLNFTPLQRTVGLLRGGWTRYRLDVTDTQIRDGLVHRFEVAYDVSRKMLKRFLEVTSANPAELDAMPLQDQIRSGNEQGLLRGDWPTWRKYRDMRGKTIHSCSENVALQVVECIPDFIEEAANLSQRLNGTDA